MNTFSCTKYTTISVQIQLVTIDHQQWLVCFDFVLDSMMSIFMPQLQAPN